MVDYVIQDERKAIEKSLSSVGFRATGEPADRHGALQWTFAKSSEGLDRLILLSEALGVDDSGYRGIVDVIVERDDQYAKKRIYATRSRPDFAKHLESSLKDAARYANATKATDLKGSFDLTPHETPPQAPFPSQLSEDDVERIARRVLNMMRAHVIEEIAENLSVTAATVKSPPGTQKKRKGARSAVTKAKRSARRVDLPRKDE